MAGRVNKHDEPGPDPAGPDKEVDSPGWLRGLYDRCLVWVASPYGIWALFFLAVAESSFFPIPPDVFLIVLCMAEPKKAFRFAGVCALGSVLGGAIGYGLGVGFMDTIGVRILDWYGLQTKYQVVQDLYRQYDAWAVAAAGFTPLPYKLFTITAGAFKINFTTFMVASILSRSARFFLVAGLIYKFGAPVRYFIERYFNLLATLFFILLIGGFFLVRLLL